MFNWNYNEHIYKHKEDIYICILPTNFIRNTHNRHIHFLLINFLCTLFELLY